MIIYAFGVHLYGFSMVSNNKWGFFSITNLLLTIYPSSILPLNIVIQEFKLGLANNITLYSCRMCDYLRILRVLQVFGYLFDRLKYV